MDFNRVPKVGVRAADCANLVPIDLSCLLSWQQIVNASFASLSVCSLCDKSLALMECVSEKCLDVCFQYHRDRAIISDGPTLGELSPSASTYLPREESWALWHQDSIVRHKQNSRRLEINLSLELEVRLAVSVGQRSGSPWYSNAIEENWCFISVSRGSSVQPFLCVLNEGLIQTWALRKACVPAAFSSHSWFEY